MKLDQLPSFLDYAMTMPASVIVLLVSVIAAIILFILLIIATSRINPSRIIAAFFIGSLVCLIVTAFSIQASNDGLAHVRGEAVSEHLKETYGVDVGFTENGVQPTDLNGLTVYDGSSVYRIAVATDGTILLVDDGGREVPRVDQ